MLLDNNLPILNENDAKNLLAGPYGDQLLRLATNHMTFIAFGTPTSKPVDLRKASCFFVKSSEKTFGVTAKHVMQALKSAQESDRSTIRQIGNTIVDLAGRQIAEGIRVDIATFEMSESEIERLEKTPITLWPPDPPNNDDKGVLISGYPAKSLSPMSEREAVFGIYTASAVAQRITDWQITIQVEWNHVQGRPELGGLPPRNFDTGGMSGGPVLSIRDRRGFQSFPLAGVISEGRIETDTFIAERADAILANGLIRS